MVALHREIEQNHSEELTVTACAPMSGPYDVSGIQADVIIQDVPYPTPYYLPYLILGYSEAYRVLKFEQVVKEPYATTIPLLFNGNIGSSEIDSALPAIPNEIIRPEVLEAFETDDNHWFRNLLRDNNVYDWAPQAPVKLMYCEGDKQISYLNSIFALEKFTENGAPDVEAINIDSDLDHGDCAIPCFQEAKEWFDSLKE